MEQVERVEDDDLLTNLADLAEHGAEEGGDDAAAIAETAPGGGNDLKLPFAFKHCSEISSSSTSSWRATCEICGKKVNTTPHKMILYGHYLQKKKQGMSVQCVSVTVLTRNHPLFVEELEKRWAMLESKRTIRLESEHVQNKRQRALSMASDGQHSFSMFDDDSNMSDCPPTSDGKSSSSETPYHFLSAAEKVKRRNECQTAWDRAFVMCGIPHVAADNPVFKDAIAKTRSCPDFQLACAKTMRTTHLDKLNTDSNKFKDKRLKAGMQLGFLITSDGWRSVAKRQYHNYLLISVEGPIFVSLVEVTGESGTGVHIHEGFETQFEKLGSQVTNNILLGVTDTPSSNRKAWRLLEAQHPKQFWVGCATHEVSLLFKEWVKTVPEILKLFNEGHRMVKFVNNHLEILALFRKLVPSHFRDKRKHCISLYMPGDTRMLTVFKMLYRISIVWPVLVDLVGRPSYDTAAQKALKQWSDRQPPEKKLVAVDGHYPDKVKHLIQSTGMLDKIQTFIACTKSVVYLKSLVDGQSPVLGKFYYSCALVDKHLRVLKEAGQVPYIDKMRSIFMKRWRPKPHTMRYWN
ncbi:hypothetical protein AB1Y20_015674 [Prymnesium parvum]|uniref:DUF659 domain-containing protein n=1 Tax=Prymnesium parvum TaxID=97485 RepID=A0AB34JZ74_PRYPA